MGKRGPSPTPTNILKMRGSWRANINPKEPIPDSGRPACPRFLSPEARKIWKRASKILAGMRVLTKAEVFVLARYCDAMSRWIETAAFLSEKGDVYPVRDKDEKVVDFKEWPQSKIYFKLDRVLIKMEQELGLTPAARTRIAAEDSGSGSGTKPTTNRWSHLVGA